MIPAPLERLPLLAPAGAVIATTDCKGDYSRRHDEPSRALRLFPGDRSGKSSTVLYEDDGLSVDGPVTEVTISLAWTPTEIQISASAHGGYALPYREVQILLPERENRIIKIEAGEESSSAVNRVKLIL
jgi:alpha-glucosidase